VFDQIPAPEISLLHSSKGRKNGRRSRGKTEQRMECMGMRPEAGEVYIEVRRACVCDGASLLERSGMAMGMGVR
jgi:hypothetical protein